MPIEQSDSPSNFRYAAISIASVPVEEGGTSLKCDQLYESYRPLLPRKKDRVGSRPFGILTALAFAFQY